MPIFTQNRSPEISYKLGSQKVNQNSHIYTFNYDRNESDVCKLESRYIFGEEEKNKLLFSNIEVEPESSAFIKRRLDIMLAAEDYPSLIASLQHENICVEGFKAEYIVVHEDTTSYADRLDKLRDIGYSIEGDPDYYNPTITYGLCCYRGVWYFGVSVKDACEWHRHKQKPHSYSHSISMRIAKSLINIAAGANQGQKLLDACCGVGTIMLEACFAGNNIEGCDLNEKICNDARENLAYFNYQAKVYHSDIGDIAQEYDAAIIDLPYNLMSDVNDDEVRHILASAAAIAGRLVIVSTSDITEMLDGIGLVILDSCHVNKKRRANVFRKIWVCEKK